MSSPESDSKVVDYEEEEQIYQWIYDMNTTNDKEEKEKVQIPSSPGHTPVHLKINAERRTHAVVGNTKGLDMDALDNIQEIPVLEVNAGEKPWRKAGADISDYFNYGFDEESWSTYCKKQLKLCAASRKLYTKIMVQKGHTRHEENEPCSAYPSAPSGSSSILASRQSSATIDVTGGRPGSSGRVEGRQCLSGEGNNTQVVTTMFPEEDRMTSYHLSPPSDISSLFAFTPSPLFPHRPGPRPLSPIATLDSGHLKGFDDPSASLYSCSSGVSCLIPRSTVPSTGVIDAAKAWECYILQEKCDKDRDRSREYGHDKDIQRGRDRDRASRSSSHNSGEERMRHRDTMERGHKRHSFERFSGEKEEQHQERRHRDTSEGWQKPSCSSSSRRDGGEDRDSQSRHKRKKAKRNKKDKETNKTCSADQERKLKI